eukprot:PhM_4_TR17225/c0_g1_i1/m.106113/K06676/BRRN1, BRN1, CAPH; condensin complex subunit 2
MSTISRSTSNRNRLLNVSADDFESGLQMATEGKVTTKNAWDIKIIEAMGDNVETVMSQANSDAYMRFSKAASVVEGAAKVWTHRVDNTHQLTTQVQRRLLRCDNKKDEEEAEADDEDGGEGESGKRSASAANEENRAKRKLERTIADTSEELTVKATDDKHFDVDPLFRATSRKFDQGHPQGLLLNNTRIGPWCNVMLGCHHAVGDSTMDSVGDAEALRRDEAVDVDVVGDGDVVDVDMSHRGESAAQQQPEVDVFDSDDDDGPNMAGGEGPVFAEQDNDFVIGDSNGNNAVTASTMADAEGFLSGSQEMDRLDRVLEQRLSSTNAIGNEPDFIPMQDAADTLRTGQTIEEIRRAAAVDLLEQNDAEPPKRRRKELKVRFVDDATVESWLVGTESSIQLLKTDDAAITTQGKEWLKQGKRFDCDQYTNPVIAARLALQSGITLAQEIEPLPTYLQNTGDIRGFFQPFCTSAKHWNFLEKRSVAMNQHGRDSGGAAMDDRDDDAFGGPVMPMLDDVVDTYSSDGDNGFEEGMSAFASIIQSSSTAEVANMELVDAPELVNMIKVKTITKPSVVDVSLLRDVMWTHTEKEHESAEKENNADNDVDARPQSPARGSGRLAPNEEGTPVEFSSVVMSMLPSVPQISKEGTLSPAFFYFSLLFLANEHGLRLEQTDDLSDVIIRY